MKRSIILFLSTFVLVMLSFVACNNGDTYVDNNEAKLKSLFEQLRSETSNFSEALNPYIGNLSSEELSKLKERLNLEPEYAMELIKESNTADKFSKLANTVSLIEQTSISESKITVYEQYLSNAPAIKKRKTRAPKPNCAEYEQRATDTANFYYLTVAACTFAGAGGPVAYAACVSLASIDFSMTMRDLERGYVGCY